MLKPDKQTSTSIGEKMLKTYDRDTAIDRYLTQYTER